MIRLSVHISEKEQVKKYGARWNPEGRFWFYPGTELPPELAPWALKNREENEVPSALEERYMSVTQLSERIREDYARDPALKNVMVQGELCNLTERKLGGGGQYYSFGLKDEYSLLPCVLWPEYIRTLSAPLENGKLMGAHGSLEYYSGQGKTQLMVKQIKELGLGDASQALLQLKNKLEAEGLFSPEWKKPLPKHPEVVGIVTSPSGQAYQDIRDVARRRNPYVQLVLYPVMVQGRQAAESIVKGLAYMDAYGADVIIVGRGGGSEEELGVYNNEAVVRAVFAAKTPIVSAVGHAGNFTLMDHVADARAATPSEAAELTVPDVMASLRRLQALIREQEAGMGRQLLQKRRRLDGQRAALEIHHPKHLLEIRRQRYQRVSENLDQSMKQLWEGKKNRFRLAINQLHALSPTAKLVKGFGYIEAEGLPLTSVEQVKTGDALTVRIHDGSLEAAVTGINRREVNV